MAVVNGNQHVKGILSAKSLLFKEVIEAADMTRGANINLVDGRLVYQIDENNQFEFYQKADIDQLLAEFVPSTPSTGGTTVTNPTYNLMNLLNATFFSVSDTTSSYLLNINFDSTADQIKMSNILDKVFSSTYKNGFLGKCEYWVSPSLLATLYKNTDVLPEFGSIKMDNSAVTPSDQTIITNLYFNDMVEWSASDITDMLDYLLISNADDNTLSADASNLISNRFFSLSWINWKLDLVTKRDLVTSLHKMILNHESIIYFFENFMSLYKNESIPRIKVYFFDYMSLVYNNIFQLVDYVKNVWNSPDDFTNILSQNILIYKADHTEITDQTKNYQSFVWDFDADELIKTIFETDTAFTNAIDWSSLDVTVSVQQWDIGDLNNPENNELTLNNNVSFDYFGNGIISPIINRINLSSGQVQVPIFEVDFPLDSLFFFMM